MDFYLSLGAVAATVFTLLCSVFYLVYGKSRDQENKIIASPPSLLCQSPIMTSPPSPPPRSWEHDVFPSFHGPDVRKHFLSHILKEFRGKGIDLFIDNEIRRGESIGPELKRAIQGSKIAVVLLSKNYASSSWCLDELVEIMSKVEGQTVLTIFYEVDPTDVKKQTGDFGKVFKKTCRGKTKKKTETWRKALEGVATIAGYHSKNSDDEAAMIENIAAEISKILNHLAPSPDMDRLIGMGAHMRKMEPFLRLDLDEVRMIGIWGPPGIGKSTIARFLFNRLSNSYQLRAIMVNIRGNYPRPCLDEASAQLQLQSQMLSQMINHKDIVISHLGVAQERLKDKKVLLVLDDLDRLAQLDALAREIRWFGPGSRIIITTEDQRVLNAHGMINHIYKVPYPTDDVALQMFCLYAFGQKSPKDGFTELCREITYLVGNLPLGLKVMGSHLRRMPKQEWTMALPMLRNSLDGEIGNVLKFSYDALCDEYKSIFLHIACIFNHGEIEKVEEHLAKKFVGVKQGLHVLAEKSLISIDGGYIQMHSLLAGLGNEIVRKQSDLEPGRRQFLVDDKDICEVVTNPTAITRSIIGINSYEYTWNGDNISERAFEGMNNLQFLRFLAGAGNRSSLLASVKYIPPKVQLLEWHYFPMTCLPSNISLEFLVEIRMSYSKLEKLWEGVKQLQNLKWMDLSYSSNLIELANLSTATNLQTLHLNGCSSLVGLPSSIGNAINLKRLYLDGCSSLVGLPSSIGNATNLQQLDLIGCSSLVELPSSIGNLHRLTEINLWGCSKLEVLPTLINLESLITLNLINCSLLKRFPEISTNIEKLYLRGTAIEEVPLSIRSWSRLEKLELLMPYSESLKESPHAFESITELHLANTEIEEIGPWVKDCSRLVRLGVRGCRKLVRLSQLPDSLMYLDAENCVSLERLDCSFRNPVILDFRNCFSLNQEARDLIIQTSTRQYSVLPGGEVPAYFTYRAPGSSLTMELNEKPLRTSTKFKACILLCNKDNDEVLDGKFWKVTCWITSKQNDLRVCRSYGDYVKPGLSEHLYIFEVEAEVVTSSTELVFEFKLENFHKTDNLKIRECGILQL